MGIALLYLGYEFNSTNPDELKKAADLLVATKKTKDCMGFKPGVGGKNDVVAGTAAAAIVYNGDAIQSMIDRFIGDLKALSEAVHTHDGQQLLDIFAAAKAARDRYVEN